MYPRSVAFASVFQQKLAWGATFYVGTIGSFIEINSFRLSIKPGGPS